jgi:hypothetical protein
MSLVVHFSAFLPPTFPTDSIILPPPPHTHISHTIQGYTAWTLHSLSSVTLRMIRHITIGCREAKQRCGLLRETVQRNDPTQLEPRLERVWEQGPSVENGRSQ